MLIPIATPKLRKQCVAFLAALGALSCAHPGTTASTGSTVAQSRGTPIVGPPHGTVMVVGGGAMGPEVYAKFIELAGGPNALIVVVPTAGGAATYTFDATGAKGFKNAGAKNIVILHATSRVVADADSFAAPLAKAGGVWFDGGRQFHLVDSYAGTRTEAGFHDVLARGGVIGGSSAGASILSSFMVRGAPSEDNFIMIYPGYTTGFGFLRGVTIDQHVVARERLADLADSVMPRHPELLGMSEDEGTVWVVQGDIAEIIGRDKAFVYGGKDPTDTGAPFMTLHPGDKYDLGARHIVHRAADETTVTAKFVDGLFEDFAHVGGPQATVLVAMNGKVFIDKSYGIGPQAKYMPTTTTPNFPLLGVSEAFNGLAAALLVHDRQLKLDSNVAELGGVTPRQYFSAQLETPVETKRFVALVAAQNAGRAGAGRGAVAGGAAAAGGRGGAGGGRGGAYAQIINTRIYTPIGEHKTAVDSAGQFMSNVDELYRLALGLDSPTTFAPDSGAAGAVDYSLGWRSDTYRGLQRLSVFGTAAGTRNAFVRIPSRHAVVIIITNSATIDAKGIAQQITDRLLSGVKAATP